MSTETAATADRTPLAQRSPEELATYLEDPDLYASWFSRMKPHAVIGHSILVYRIPESLP